MNKTDRKTDRQTDRQRATHTRKGKADTARKEETSILMTHDSLFNIEVTDATFHESRGWLKALAPWNTAHTSKYNMGMNTYGIQKKEQQA